LSSSILKAFFLFYFHLDKCGDDNDASVATFVANSFLMLDTAALEHWTNVTKSCWSLALTPPPSLFCLDIYGTLYVFYISLCDSACVHSLVTNFPEYLNKLWHPWANLIRKCIRKLHLQFLKLFVNNAVLKLIWQTKNDFYFH